jgi:hypothetical protein
VGSISALLSYPELWPAPPTALTSTRTPAIKALKIRILPEQILSLRWIVTFSLQPLRWVQCGQTYRTAINIVCR